MHEIMAGHEPLPELDNLASKTTRFDRSSPHSGTDLKFLSFTVFRVTRSCASAGFSNTEGRMSVFGGVIALEGQYQ